MPVQIASDKTAEKDIERIYREPIGLLGNRRMDAVMEIR